MNESYVTVSGNVTADPVLRHTKQGRPFATFRVASTTRRYDAHTGRWVDAGTNYISVVTFNLLAANVVSSIFKGQPVVVYGRLRVNQWTDKTGKGMTSVEVEGHHVGHDLCWGMAQFHKSGRPQPDANDKLADDEVQDALRQAHERDEDRALAPEEDIVDRTLEEEMPPEDDSAGERSHDAASGRELADAGYVIARSA